MSSQPSLWPFGHFQQSHGGLRKLIGCDSVASEGSHPTPADPNRRWLHTLRMRQQAFATCGLNRNQLELHTGSIYQVANLVDYILSPFGTSYGHDMARQTQTYLLQPEVPQSTKPGNAALLQADQNKEPSRQPLKAATAQASTWLICYRFTHSLRLANSDSSIHIISLSSAFRSTSHLAPAYSGRYHPLTAHCTATTGICMLPPSPRAWLPAPGSAALDRGGIVA